MQDYNIKTRLYGLCRFILSMYQCYSQSRIIELLIIIYIQIKRMIILLPIIFVLSRQLDSDLPPAIKTQYQDTVLPFKNVTIGDRFHIPLSSFDAQWQKGNFNFYELNKQQFEAAQVQDKQRVKGQEIGTDYLPFECNLKAGRAFVRQEIKNIQQQYSKFMKNVWQQNQFVHISFKSLLYILKTSSSQLVAYMYNSATLDKVTALDIHPYVERQENHTVSSVSAPVIALNSNESLLYLFTSLGIWQIQTRTVLAEIKRVEDISGFNSRDFQGIDSFIHGQSGVMVGMKRYIKVFLVPEISSGNKYKQIKQFGNDSYFLPQDIKMIGDILYVLDYQNGVYIYNIYKDGQHRQKLKIAFEPFGGNLKFQVYQNTIFINFNDRDGSKVVEINYDLGLEKSYLVRYIKSFQYITSLNVINALTIYEGQPRQNTFRQDAFESYLFLTLNFDDVQIYPFNLDPRIINQPFNSVRLKASNIRKIFHVKTDYYLVVTNEQVKYLRISIEKPVMGCRTKRVQSSSSSKYFKISVKSNISTCEHMNHALGEKGEKKFYAYCSYLSNHYIHLGDPEQSYFQRVKLYSFVLAAFVLFVTGLVCLMQWRKNKMMLLRRMKEQILRFRNRHKKMQPFGEYQVEQKDIQIEVPEFVGPSLQTEQ